MSSEAKPVVPPKPPVDPLTKHNSDYVRPDAYKGYTSEELAWWVRLLTKRAGMRVAGDKKTKDIYDARNYLKMFREAVQDEALNFNRLLADTLEHELNRVAG